MNNEVMEPKLRFNEFEDNWTLNNFMNLVEFFNGLTYSPSNIKNSGTFVLRSSNVKNNKIINADNVYVDINAINSEFVKKDDIVIVVRNGSKNFIGKHAVIKKHMKNTVVGAFMLIIRSKNNNFINALLNTNNFYKNIHKSLGATINQITKKDFKLMNYYVPFNLEQQKIGSFFEKLDRIIELQENKIDHWNNLKKGYLQKVFNVKHGNLIKLNLVINKNNEKNKNLIVKNIQSISNKFGFINQDKQFNDYFVASKDLSNYYIIRNNMFAYNPSRINVGSIAYKNKNESIGIVSPLYVSFYTNDNINDMYLYYWIKSEVFEKQRYVYSEGGVRDTLSFKQFSDMHIDLPKLQEQQKVGLFFEKIDKIIDLQEQKLEHLKQLKKGYLQNMFC